MDRLQKWIAIILLLFSLGFNLWLYRAEPTTMIDPNDNAFQFALVERTNEMWEFANRTCPKTILFPICHVSYLIDHWVPNWAQGYNLPYYYSHVPQILIVSSYRFLSQLSINNYQLTISLFQYYHFIIYLLLCFFPLSLFLAFRILKFPWLTAGIAALFASQISTDGLYGIDQSSFLWRGWGLSSQLFALIWLPLAIASIIQWTKEASWKLYIRSIVFLVLTIMGHLGIGMMAFLAIPVICLTPALLSLAEKQKRRQVIESLVSGVKQTIFLAIPPLLILSYWIVPAFLNNNFHNISVWDPVWKFNSFGAKEVVTMLVNGTLFDFGRFPILIILVFIGLFATIQNGFPHIAFLFLSFLLLFFGRTTWGGILNLIPGMSEFHQHRFIVGVHLAGLFLAPIGLTWIAEKILNINLLAPRSPASPAGRLWRSGVYSFICLFIYWLIVPQTLSYASYNTTLIVQANAAYQQNNDSFALLLGTLKELEMANPGRVYALRGSEGKAFQIASTPYYMQLSTYGIPTVLWLPETWSMNSDTEQFFSEDNPYHYNLYNIKYVVTSPTKQPQPFWKLLKETEHWKLYTVDTDGYITLGTAPSIVTAKKTDIINLIHLWIQSEYSGKNIFPELSIHNTQYTIHNTDLPSFSMLDPVTYQTPDNTIHSLFADVPVYLSPLSDLSDLVKITSQSSDSDMLFRATVEVKETCTTCVVVLKQTYHPNWRAEVNDEAVKPIIVFPFFTAIRLEQPGMFTVVFSYAPKFGALDIQ